MWLSEDDLRWKAPSHHSAAILTNSEPCIICSALYTGFGFSLAVGAAYTHSVLRGNMTLPIEECLAEHVLFTLLTDELCK